MAGTFVCKRTGLANARAVADVYAYRGYQNIQLVLNRGLFQVVVRGGLVRRHKPTGLCCSFGGGVPPLSRLSPELFSIIEREREQRKMETAR